MTAPNETNQPSHPLNEPASTHDLILERILDSRTEDLPEDIPAQPGEPAPALEKKEQVDLDENHLTKQVTRYLAQERREKLDQQIEALYERVTQESGHSLKDVGTALIQLRKAHDITLEDKRHYDEALYLITTVKERLIHRNTLRRWAQTWGLFIFFYALAWLILLGIAFFIDIEALISLIPEYLETAWYAALAGGIGGTIGILYHFSRIVSKNEFDRQDAMRYLVQPIIGFILGLVMFFMVSSGLLLVSDPFGGPAEALTLSQFVLIFLGGLAGFGQEIIYQGVEEVISRFSGNRSRSGQSTLPPE